MYGESVVVRESRERERLREGEGRVIVGGHGTESETAERATGKRASDSHPAKGHSKGRAELLLRLAARPAEKWPVLFQTVTYQALLRPAPAQSCRYRPRYVLKMGRSTSNNLTR